MIRRIFRSLYFLTFLNGFLLATLIYFQMEASYEQKLFKAIQFHVDNKIKLTDAKDSLVVKVMHACNALLTERQSMFSNQEMDGIKADLHPTSLDLMTAQGACGSYALVLTRLLKNYDYSVRIAQMKVNGVYAAHNVVEVKTGKNWVVLDPLFNLYFIKPSGHELASFADVKNNWVYYSKQVPASYDQGYRYEDVRYSNWGKIPFLLPATKKVLDLVLGKEKADSISIRTYFLKTYDLFFYGTLLLLIPVFLYAIKRMIQIKIFPQPNIPLTYSNLIRYIKAKLTHEQLESSVNT
jgi:hypothetical protein